VFSGLIYDQSLVAFFLFVGSWSIGIVLVIYGSSRTKEEETMKFGQKTPEPEPVPGIGGKPYWVESELKIRCPYCGFLYDGTLDKCPQCGDRR